MNLIGQRAALASLAVLGIAGGLIYYTSRDMTLPAQTMDTAPAGTRGLLRVDVPALRRSSFYQKLIVEPGRDAGHRALVERCGFDPLDQLEDLVIFVSGDGSQLSHSGVIGRGPFEHERLAECIRQAATEDGSELERTEVEGLSAVKVGAGEGVLAFLGKRGMAWGRRETVVSIIHAVRGEGGRASEDELLNRLYNAIGRDREVVFVTHIPAAWIPALRQLAQARGAEVASIAEPFFGTKAVGIGARVSVGLAVGALFTMNDAAEAESLTTMLRTQLDSIIEQPLIAMSPVGPALRRINVNQSGADVNVAFDLPQDRVDTLMELATRFGMAGGGPGPGQPPGPLVGPGGTFAPGAATAPSAPPVPVPADALGTPSSTEAPAAP